MLLKKRAPILGGKFKFYFRQLRLMGRIVFNLELRFNIIA